MNQRLELAKAVIREGDKYLLLRRSSDSHYYPDLWDFVGGKLDSRETPSEAVVRETKEETSFDIVSGDEIKQCLYEDNDTGHSLLFHYFTPESVSGELRLSPAHSEYQWVAREEMDGLKLHSSVREFFKES